MQPFCSRVCAFVLSAALLSSGCTSTLVRDEVKRTAEVEGHCSGSEWVDDSSIAVLPVPVVSFVTPHVDLRNVSGEPYVSRCGASTQVINRDVSVNRVACIPAGLTRIISLGVWQWCPVRVTWSADVLANMPSSTTFSLGQQRKQKS